MREGGKVIACRGVAQPGSVLAWGASGRPFKSAHPDQQPHGKAIVSIRSPFLLSNFLLKCRHDYPHLK